MGLWRGLRGWMGLLGRDSRMKVCLYSESLFVRTLNIRNMFTEP